MLSRNPRTHHDRSSKSRYRWLRIWLGAGCVMALLLMANSIRDYNVVSGYLAMLQTHHQMQQISAQVGQQVRRYGLSANTLAEALASRAGAHEYEAAQLHDQNGALLQSAGSNFPAVTFSSDDVHNAFIKGDPLYRLVPAPAGWGRIRRVQVEAFGIRQPRDAQPQPQPQSDLSTLPNPPPPWVLEIALPVGDADPAYLGPIRRNLAINLAAALSLLATVVVLAIGLRSYVRGRALEEQVEIARQVQERLLPAGALSLPGIQIATEYKPFEEVSGDFYDVFSDRPGEVALVLGDVSGKGIPAALLMGVIHGAVRTSAWQETCAGLEEESRKLNLLLCEHASGNHYATMFWCVYDGPEHALRYVNAGHCPPLLTRRVDGQLQTVRLTAGGTVLGLVPEVPYESATVPVLPGDLLVLYSDGLGETANPAGEEFGDDRLIELVQRSFDASPEQLRLQILDALKAFAGKAEAQDDLTFAVVRF